MAATEKAKQHGKDSSKGNKRLWLLELVSSSPTQQHKDISAHSEDGGSSHKKEAALKVDDTSKQSKNNSSSTKKNIGLVSKRNATHDISTIPTTNDINSESEQVKLLAYKSSQYEIKALPSIEMNSTAIHETIETRLSSSPKPMIASNEKDVDISAESGHDADTVTNKISAFNQKAIPVVTTINEPNEAVGKKMISSKNQKVEISVQRTPSVYISNNTVPIDMENSSEQIKDMTSSVRNTNELKSELKTVTKAKTSEPVLEAISSKVGVDKLRDAYESKKPTIELINSNMVVDISQDRSSEIKGEIVMDKREHKTVNRSVVNEKNKEQIDNNAKHVIVKTIVTSERTVDHKETEARHKIALAVSEEFSESSRKEKKVELKEEPIKIKSKKEEMQVTNVYVEKTVEPDKKMNGDVLSISDLSKQKRIYEVRAKNKPVPKPKPKSKLIKKEGSAKPVVELTPSDVVEEKPKEISERTKVEIIDKVKDNSVKSESMAGQIKDNISPQVNYVTTNTIVTCKTMLDTENRSSSEEQFNERVKESAAYEPTYEVPQIILRSPSELKNIETIEERMKPEITTVATEEVISNTIEDSIRKENVIVSKKIYTESSKQEENSNRIEGIDSSNTVLQTLQISKSYIEEIKEESSGKMEVEPISITKKVLEEDKSISTDLSYLNMASYTEEPVYAAVRKQSKNALRRGNEDIVIEINGEDCVGTNFTLDSKEFTGERDKQYESSMVEMREEVEPSYESLSIVQSSFRKEDSTERAFDEVEILFEEDDETDYAVKHYEQVIIDEDKSGYAASSVITKDVAILNEEVHTNDNPGYTHEMEMVFDNLDNIPDTPGYSDEKEMILNDVDDNPDYSGYSEEKEILFNSVYNNPDYSGYSEEKEIIFNGVYENPNYSGYSEEKEMIFDINNVAGDSGGYDDEVEMVIEDNYEKFNYTDHIGKADIVPDVSASNIISNKRSNGIISTEKIGDNFRKVGVKESEMMVRSEAIISTEGIGDESQKVDVKESEMMVRSKEIISAERTGEESRKAGVKESEKVRSKETISTERIGDDSRKVGVKEAEMMVRTKEIISTERTGDESRKLGVKESGMVARKSKGEVEFADSVSIKEFRREKSNSLTSTSSKTSNSVRKSKNRFSMPVSLMKYFDSNSPKTQSLPHMKKKNEKILKSLREIPFDGEVVSENSVAKLEASNKENSVKKRLFSSRHRPKSEHLEQVYDASFERFLSEKGNMGEVDLKYEINEIHNVSKEIKFEDTLPPFKPLFVHDDPNHSNSMKKRRSETSWNAQSKLNDYFKGRSQTMREEVKYNDGLLY